MRLNRPLHGQRQLQLQCSWGENRDGRPEGCAAKTGLGVSQIQGRRQRWLPGLMRLNRPLHGQRRLQLQYSCGENFDAQPEGCATKTGLGVPQIQGRRQRWLRGSMRLNWPLHGQRRLQLQYSCGENRYAQPEGCATKTGLGSRNWAGGFSFALDKRIERAVICVLGRYWTFVQVTARIF